jgi:hypothetical protein
VSLNKLSMDYIYTMKNKSRTTLASGVIDTPKNINHVDPGYVKCRTEHLWYCEVSHLVLDTVGCRGRRGAPVVALRRCRHPTRREPPPAAGDGFAAAPKKLLARTIRQPSEELNQGLRLLDLDSCPFRPSPAKPSLVAQTKEMPSLEKKKGSSQKK